MKKAKHLCASVAAILMMLGPVLAWALEPVVLNQKPVELGVSSGWDYALDATGKGWLAYYDKEDSSLYIRRPDGSEVALGATDRPRAQSGLAMTVTGDNVAVLWRDKLPHKTLYLLPALSTGTPEKPLEVSGPESEALPRVRLERRDGTTYMLWLGEKGDEKEGQRYHLYFRYLDADGKTLSPVERVLPGFYPAWIIDHDLIPVFSWASVDGQLSMFMRVFDRAQKTFGPQVRIADAPPLSPFFQAFASAGRWFLLWIGHHGDQHEQWLEGISSDDHGQTWKRFDFEKLHGLDFSRLEATTDEKGHILIAVSGVRPLGESKGKNDVYILRSADNGTTWSEPFQPRPTELQGVFAARDPSIAFGAKPGTVMLIWEDWRNLRPNIYVRFSTDSGATWGEALSLEASPAVRLNLDFKNQTAWTAGDRYQIIAKRYPDDSFMQGDLVRYDFKAEELQQQAAESAGKDQWKNRNESRLRQRLEVFWKSLETEDISTSYTLHDPFFRKRVPYQGYESNRGPMKYESHEIVSVTVQGNLAKVQMKFDASVPEFMWHGKPFSKPRSTIEQIETWLFIDGDWFREYHDLVHDVRYTKY